MNGTIYLHRTGARGGRAWMLRVVAVLALAAITGCSGVFIPKEARGEMDAANVQIGVAAELAIKSAESIAALKMLLEPLKKQIEDAVRRIKNKEVPVVEGMAVYNGLLQKKEAIQTRLAELKERLIAAKEAGVKAVAHIKALRDKHGVAWWQIALSVGLSLVGGGAAVGIPGLRRLATVAQVLTQTESERDDAHEVIKIYDGAIATGKNPSSIREQVDNTNHPLIGKIRDEAATEKAKSHIESA